MTSPNFKSAVALSLFVALAACKSNPTKEEIGIVSGAVVGGIVGSALTGSTVGTVGGAAAGAYAGHRIGTELQKR